MKKFTEYRVEGSRPVGQPRRTWLESVDNLKSTDKMYMTNKYFITILGHCLTTRPGRNAVYYMTWSGLSPTICPGRDAELQHVLVWTQFYDMPWSGRSFTTCPGYDAVL